MHTDVMFFGGGAGLANKLTLNTKIEQQVFQLLFYCPVLFMADLPSPRNKGYEIVCSMKISLFP